MLRVGLPNATQIISVSSSVSAPSATSHTLSAIAEASSNTSKILLPLLCKPAKASVLCSLHGTKSARHVFACDLSLTAILVADTSNHSRVILKRCHFPTSGAVFVRNCVSVLEVSTTLQSSQVLKAQFTNIPINADFPIPCPEARASISGI